MTISSLLKNPTEAIECFLASKTLSASSSQAYRYDLEQFIQAVGQTIDRTQLSFYEQSLSALKPAARKRKLSAVNQFLRYLYQQGQIEEFYHLSVKSALQPPRLKTGLLDLSSLYEGESCAGKLASLLILDLGLLPAEILAIENKNIDLDFAVVTIIKDQTKRVLTLSPALLEALSTLADNWSGLYLLGRGDKAYSRQWLFRHLQVYLTSQGFPELNAQSLRQQFILKEIKQGTDAFELARKLGLKSPVTLERYYQV
ncbi:site-specific tyrosine recombinase XerD [Streptococcus dentiloxodontae]